MFVFPRSDQTDPWTGLQNLLLLFNASNSKASFPLPVALFTIWSEYVVQVCLWFVLARIRL